MNAPLFDRTRCPDEKTAAICEGSVWTYAQLRRLAGERIAWLESRGVRKDTLVAVHSPSDFELLVLVHALWAIGGTLVPLNARLTRAERSAQLARLGRALYLERGGEDWRATWLDNTPLANPPRGMQLLLFTSGTTGMPKGALLSFEAIAASAAAAKQALDYNEGERWLCCLPLFHVAGLSILYRCAFYGASVVLHPKFDARALNDAVEHERVTALSLVPTQLSAWLEVRGDRPVPWDLRSILLGGAKASPALLRKAQELALPLAPTFGMTETASQVCTLTPAQFARCDVAQNLHLPALPGVETRVCNEQGHELREGEAGEVWLRGPSLFSGYLDDPGATRAAFTSDGWFRTGDWGIRDESGALAVVERRSDLIISGGENIYPAEVEALLESHRDVREAGVFALADERWGQCVAAALVTDTQVSEKQLAAYCRERMAAYKCPKAFFIVEALPRTATGKLQRGKLRAEFTPYEAMRA